MFLDRMVRPYKQDERRERFERAGRQLIALDDRVAAGFGQVEKGTLVRAMLDVERGALFHYRLDHGWYLVGATLEQKWLLRAQRKLDALALKYQAFPNGTPDTGPVRIRDLVIEHPVVYCDTPAAHAARLIADHNVSGVIVLDRHDRPVSILDGVDLLRLIVPSAIREDPSRARLEEDGHAEVFLRELDGRTVGHCLPQDSPRLLCVHPMATALEVAGQMSRANCSLAAVVDEEKFIGVILLNSLISIGSF
jgi:CBS domain-containing protein